MNQQDLKVFDDFGNVVVKHVIEHGVHLHVIRSCPYIFYCTVRLTETYFILPKLTFIFDSGKIKHLQ